MDIGLEKLIDMIEKRLGKTAADLLFGLIILAVVGESCHLIYLYLVLPVIHGAATGIGWLATIRTPHVGTSSSILSAKQIMTVLLWLAEAAVVIFVLVILGGVARLAYQDHLIARDIRSNPGSVKNLEQWNRRKRF